MNATATLQQHVFLDENGEARVSDTRMRVIDLVIAHQFHGWNVAELHAQFPDISMSEAHSALAYYWDNKAALDDAIKEQERFVQKLREQIGESPAVKRLRKLGYLQ